MFSGKGVTSGPPIGWGGVLFDMSFTTATGKNISTDGLLSQGSSPFSAYEQAPVRAIPLDFKAPSDKRSADIFGEFDPVLLSTILAADKGSSPAPVHVHAGAASASQAPRRAGAKKEGALEAASVYAKIPKLGGDAIPDARFWSVNLESRKQLCTLVLADGSKINWTATLKADNSGIEAIEGAEIIFIDIKGKSHHERIGSRICRNPRTNEPFNWRIELDLPGRKKFPIELALHIETHSVIAPTLNLAATQPHGNLPAPAIASQPIAAQFHEPQFAVLIKEGDMGMQSGGGISRRTCSIVMTNGDVIRFTYKAFKASGYSRKRSLEMEEAVLIPIIASSEQRGKKIDISVTVTGGPSGGSLKFEGGIEGRRYKIDLPYTYETAHFVERFHEDRINVISVPYVENVHPIFAGQTTVSKPEVFLRPDDASVRILQNPPWLDNEPAEIRFIGRVGGRVCDETAPLAIKGKFVRGRFIPDAADDGMPVPHALFAANGFVENPMRIDISYDGASEKIRATLADIHGTEYNLCVHSDGSLISFGMNEAEAREAMGKIFREISLPQSDPAARGAWMDVTEEIRREIARAFDRSAVDFDSVKIAAGAKDTIRVSLKNGRQLTMERRDLGGSISYKILDDGVSLTALLLGWGFGQSVHGLKWPGTMGAPPVLSSPWRGQMSFHGQTGDKKIFKDPDDGTVALNLTRDGENYALSVEIEKLSQGTLWRGLMSGTAYRGQKNIAFTLGTGDTLEFHLPEDMDAEDAILTLDAKPAGSCPEVTVTLADALGKEEKGRLEIDGGKWVIALENGKRIAVDVTIGEGRQFGDFFLSRFSARPGITAVALPPPAPPPAPAPKAPTLPAPALSRPSLPRRTPSFPDERDIFLLPTQEARLKMRDALENPGKFIVGDTTTFEFLGDPYVKRLDQIDPRERNRQYSAMRIAREYKRHGAKSREFMGWRLEVPFVWDGQWVPDTSRRAKVKRIIPSLDGEGRVIGNREYYYDEAAAFDVVYEGTRWSLKFGPDVLVQPFRGIVGQGIHAHRTLDFGLSIGPPTLEAVERLGFITGKTGGADERARMLVEAAVDGKGAVRGRLAPRFGDPVVRSRAQIGPENVAIVELAPGYSDRLPSSLFSVISVHDGAGANLKFVFQHSKDETSLVGCESSGQPQDIQGFETERGDDGSVTIAGDIKMEGRHSSVVRRHNIPFSIRFATRKEGHFEVREISYNDHSLEYEPGAMSFITDAGLWDFAHINQSREDKEVFVAAARVRAGGGTGKGGRRPVPRKIGADGIPTEAHYYLPSADLRRAMARNATPKSSEIEFIEDVDDGQPERVRISLKYNEELRVWEPDYKGEQRSGESIEGRVRCWTPNLGYIDVPCARTLTGRNWRLNFPGGRNAYLGNFVTAETIEGGPAARPTPVLWRTDAADPHRQIVESHLERQDLAVRAVRDMPIYMDTDVEADGSFDIEISHGDRTYKIPMRVYNTPGSTGFMAVPRGPLTVRTGDKTQSAVIEWYQPTKPGAKAFMEFDGLAFELSLNTRKRFGEAEPDLKSFRVALKQTHPGVAGLLTKERSQTHVRIEPGDASAMLFADPSDTEFKAEAEGTLKSGEILKRQVWDAITGQCYEFAFGIEAQGSKMHLIPKGVAKLTDEGAVSAGKEYVEIGNKVYLRLSDNQYLHVNTFAGERLVVYSHGRTLNEPTLRMQDWKELDDSGVVYSKARPAPPEVKFAAGVRPKRRPDDEQPYYHLPLGRQRATEHIALRYGIGQTLLWDLYRHDFPHGLTFTMREVDMRFPTRRVFEWASPKWKEGREPAIRVTTNFRGNWPFGDAEVTFYGKKIRSETFNVEGRPYLVLHGPMEGVAFYWDSVSKGVMNLIELTVPELRERLTRDMDANFPLPQRKKFKDDRAYPPITGLLERELIAQIARARISGIHSDALPHSWSARTKISELLIGNMDIKRPYSAPDKPQILSAIEDVSKQPAFRNELHVVLEGLAAGHLNMGEIEHLAEQMRAYLTNRSNESAFHRASTALETLAQKSLDGFERTRVEEAGTRRGAINLGLAQTTLKHILHEAYGEAGDEGLGGKPMHGDITLDAIRERIKPILGDRDFGIAQGLLANHQKENPMTPMEEASFWFEAALSRAPDIEAGTEAALFRFKMMLSAMARLTGRQRPYLQRLEPGAGEKPSPATASASLDGLIIEMHRRLPRPKVKTVR